MEIHIPYFSGNDAMPIIKANDIEINYEVKGSGTPLMLINGWGCNLNSWSTKMVDLLAENPMVVLMDNRGTGRSGKPDIIYTMNLMAEDTLTVLNARAQYGGNYSPNLWVKLSR